MRHLFTTPLLLATIICTGAGCSILTSGERSSEIAESSDRTDYYIHPNDGSDARSGLATEEAWRSFAPLNRQELKPGDRVHILAPGHFDQSLRISGSGSRAAPIEVHFAPGRYDFFPENALRRTFNISNTNADPEGEKAIGIFLEQARHVRIHGHGARIVFRGKMIEVCIDRSEDITISDLKFDYHRPTVSEYRVTENDGDHLEIKVHRDSQYEIRDGRLVWIGEGWEKTGNLTQELDPETDVVRRTRKSLQNLQIEEIEPFHLRARGKSDLKAGHIYQVRDTFRDYAAVFTRRSKDIVWKDIHFHFLHGMGLVSQFSENLTFDNVVIAPDPKSGRTTAAWADGIHVSGCRGKVQIKDCSFSGMHDDPINIHGTHLRVVERISDNQIRVRFMHKQTFGFMAFNPGDDITFVRWDSLETYAPNTVEEAELLNPKEMRLTLAQPVPESLREKDVVENVTWTPEVLITGCEVRRTPTRGFLLTTRRKAVIENNKFYRTWMSAILLENDASGWYESGAIRDLTIRGNEFFYCREPVIHINPRNSIENDSVHRNIRIEGNRFWLSDKVAIEARSTKGLTIAGNRFYADQTLDPKEAIRIEDCADVTIRRNESFPIED
ncbi:right-handed parallel beta-helix repeat-containing protein [Coraliomargarita sinensis]|nr:right-handed parallel beta-helix repeat-containing protein [Coraliomargarita sinensis]